MTDKEMNLISERINEQKGKKYSCGNQSVICGFFSTEEDWENFINNNRNRIKIQQKDRVMFDNKEQWRHFDYNNYSCRGYRFYKIKVSHNIDNKTFIERIYPWCCLYCKKIEWI